jgi:hypothetical protein
MSSDNNSVFLLGGIAALAFWLFGSSKDQSPKVTPTAAPQPQPQTQTQTPPATSSDKDEKAPEQPVGPPPPTSKMGQKYEL